MRLLFTVLLLSSFAFAQEAQPPAPAKKPEPAADTWKVTKPESNPQGEVISLKVARDPTKKRTVTLMLERGENTSLGLTGNVSMSDEANFSWPLQLTKLVQNGMDITPMAAAQFQNASLAGKLTANGRIAKGSVTVTATVADAAPAPSAPACGCGE